LTRFGHRALFTRQGTYEQFLDTIAARQIPYLEAQQNDTITAGNLSFDVVYGQSSSAELNNTSLILHLQYGEVSFLFTGDAEASAEAEMLRTAEAQRLAAIVLKVVHHGSYTSSSPEFLAAVQPQLAIYSAGRNNSYGHPHSATIDNLLAVRATVYGTDEAGTIVETDGDSIQVHTTVPATLEFASVDATLILEYDPLGPDRDCGHFDTHKDAQAFFIAAGGTDSDPHRLDGDNDGIACESLP
jgi:competence protein ComEC